MVKQLAKVYVARICYIWIQTQIRLQRWTARHFYQCLYSMSTMVTFCLSIVYSLNSSRLPLSLRFTLSGLENLHVYSSVTIVNIMFLINCISLFPYWKIESNRWSRDKFLNLFWRTKEWQEAFRHFFLKCKHAALARNKAVINTAINDLISYWQINWGLSLTMMREQTLGVLLNFIVVIFSQLQMAMCSYNCLTFFLNRSIFFLSGNIISFIILTELARSTTQ